MPSFLYQVRDDQGRLAEGEIEAPSMDQARARLSRAFEVVVSLERARRQSRIRWRPPLPGSVLTGFLRQFVMLLEVGIPCQRAVHYLAEGEPHRRLRTILRLMTRKLEAGWEISQALREHPGAFPPLLVRLVQTGEETGRLIETLRRVAQFQDRWLGVRRRIAAALAYPLVLAATVALVVAVIGFLVVPRMARILTLTGDVLPLPTRALLWLVGAVREPGTWLALGVLALAAVYLAGRLLPWVPQLRERLDQVLLRAPVVGPFLEGSAVARMLHALVTVLRAGPGSSHHLEVVELVAGNAVMSRRFREARLDMLEGQGMADAFEAHGTFPSLVLQMVRVGEETGTLEAMLSRSAALYEEEVNSALERLQTLLEPASLAVMGLLIVLVALALGLPTINLLYRVS